MEIAANGSRCSSVNAGGDAAQAERVLLIIERVAPLAGLGQIFLQMQRETSVACV